MDPDDPEARIRELEVGSFSENPGIAPPPPRMPPPPAPPPYGTAPPPQYGTGFGTGAPYGPQSPMPPFGVNPNAGDQGAPVLVLGALPWRS